MEPFWGVLNLVTGIVAMILLMRALQANADELVFLWSLLAPLSFLNAGLCLGGSVEHARQRQLAIESHAQDAPDEKG